MVDRSLQDHAIKAALEQNWTEAIEKNLHILKQKKQDQDALMRLAYAYMRTGKTTLAKQTYEKILASDKYNQIATKNLKKLTTAKKSDSTTEMHTVLSPLMFLEEPGRTKIVDCIHIAPPNTLSMLSPGQEIVLVAKKHCIELRTKTHVYLGALPDDLSFKLIKLLSGGNTYNVIVKSIEKNSLQIIIRELTRGKKYIHQPSFTSHTSYVPFTRSSIKNETEDEESIDETE